MNIQVNKSIKEWRSENGTYIDSLQLSSGGYLNKRMAVREEAFPTEAQ